MRNFSKLFLFSALAAAMVCPTSAVAMPHYPDTVRIPERAVVVNGSREYAPGSLLAVIYSTENLDFQDPHAPRFLFVDRKGKIALGIGGYVKGVASYDFRGAINSPGFITSSIPVPADPALRNKFQMSATHSTIFLNLVGNTSLFGPVSVYLQSDFSGGSDHHEFKLKQAYVQLGYVTAGLARSTFDDAAEVPTIDYQGPSGDISVKNVLLQYAPSLGDNWKAAISIENPKATYTTAPATEAISQRMPDIPAYIQYNFGGDKEHIRLSAIYRNLSYRNTLSGNNHAVSGWGIQLSGSFSPLQAFKVYYEGNYGRGIGQYINDFSGLGYDLIPSGTPGEMKAPGTLGFVGGIQWNISDRLFVSAAYSQSRLYDQQTMGSSAYRYGQYIVANAFYTLFPDCQIGIEYNYGRRTNLDGASNSANRLSAAIQYNF